jgi:hypothetical protein
VRHYCNTSIEVSYELLKNTDIDSSLDIDIAKALEQDRDDRLHEAVEALSEKISETVKLHYLEGLSVEEISEKLNILACNVKWRLSEGRRQLRKEYGVMEENKKVTTPAFLCRFGQSDKKADCASARQSLCGIALNQYILFSRYFCVTFTNS